MEWPVGSDPDAHEALVRCVEESDTVAIVERIEALTAALHGVKTPLAKVRLRLELAEIATDKALAGGTTCEVVAALRKIQSELGLVMKEFGWCRKPEGNAAALVG